MALQNQVLVFCGRPHGHHRSNVELRKMVERAGGKIAFSVTKNETTFVIATEEEFSRKSLNIRVAKKLNVPIVREEFIQACIDAEKLVDPAPFLLKASVESDSASPAKNMSASIDIVPLEPAAEEQVALAMDAGAWEKSQRVRLFVSSTFRDMMAEREALATGALRQLATICEERGAFFAAIDLRWGVTAEQAAAGKTLAVCLREVAACSPYFLAVLGQRYGGRIDKGQIQTAISELRASSDLGSPSRELAVWLTLESDSLVGLSITEMEIRAAIRLAAVGAMSGISARCYFFERDLSDLTAEERSRIESDTDADSIQKLKDLKQLIKSQGFVLEGYKNVQRLSELVAAEVGEVLRADLAARQQQRSQASLATAPSNPINWDAQAGAHQSYAWTRAATFVGRAELMSDLQSYMTGSSDEAGASKAVAIRADAGAGKSSLLSALYAAACDASDRLQSFGDRPLILAHFPSAAADPSASFFAARVLSALKKRYELSLPLPSADQASCSELSSWLQLASSQKSARVVLLVDDLDLMVKDSSAVGGLNKSNGNNSEGSNAPKFDMSWLPTDLPAGVRVIYACEDSLISSSLLMARGCRTIELAPLSESERQEVTTKYLKVHGQQLTTEQLKKISTASNQTFSSPLMIRSALDYLRMYSTFEKLDATLESILRCSTFEALFRQHLGDTERAFGADCVSATLCAIAVSRRGLAEADLPQIFSASSTSENEKTVLAMGTWAALYSALRPDILSPLGGLVSFTHPKVRAAVYGAYLGKPELEAQYRNRLIRFVRNQLSSSASSCSDTRRIYLLTELLYQIQKCGSNEEYLQEILDPRYLTLKWKDTWLRSSILSFWCKKQLQEKVSPSSAAKAHIEALNSARNLSDTDRNATRVVIAYLCKELGAYREALQVLSLASKFYSQEHLRLSSETAFEEGDSSSTNLNAETAVKLSQIYELECESMIQLADYENAEKKIASALKLASALPSQTMIVSATARCHSLEGKLHQLCGRFAKAKESFHKALEANESLPRTSDVRYIESTLLTQLGDAARQLEHYSEAREFYAKARSLMSKVCGENDIRMAELIAAEGLVAKKLAQYDLAEQLYQNALSLVVRHRNLLNLFSSGADHPQSSHIRAQLADVYRKAEKFDEAANIYHQALESMQKSLGETHPDVAELMAATATLDKKRGKYEEALRWYEKACAIGEAVLGSKHAKVAGYQLGRAEVLRKFGRFSEALSAYERARDGITVALGPQHPELIDVLQGMGLIHKKNAHYELAQEAYEQALSIADRAYGPAHYKCGLLLNNLADIHRKRHQVATAMPLYEKALQILTKALGHDHSEVAEVLTNMSLVERDEGNLPTAEKLLNESLKIFERHFGHTHYKCANVIHLLAEVARRREMYAEAQTLFVRSLQMTVATLGENHPEVADVCYDYAMLLNQQGRFDDAQAELRRGLKIVTAAFGEAHPKVAQFKSNITHW